MVINKHSYISLNQNIKKEIIQWDCFNWSRALDFWQEHGGVNLPDASALELGARDGGLSLWLALNKANVMCSDYEISRMEEAVKLHQKHKVSSLVAYEAVDAMNIPYEKKFDLVVFKSILGGISWKMGEDAKYQVIKSIHRSLKKGGELWFAENLSASIVHSMARKYLKKGWSYPHHTEIPKLFSDFSSLEFKAIGCLATFGRSESQRGFMGKIDQQIIEKFVPDKWKYIAVGVARK